MSDDFRLKVTAGDRRDAVLLCERLSRGELEHALGAGAEDRIAVSCDGHDVFLYASTRSQADAAASAVTALAAQQGWHIELEMRRWHPVSEEWEDPDAPLPATEDELASERAALLSRERAESEALGIPEYEVRIECGSHRATVELAERLAEEGLAPVRRWRYLLVGAADEEAAQELADRLAGEVPAGTSVTVEASMAAVAAETPPNPFAVFGGLGV
jgi:hypothetical protein